MTVGRPVRKRDNGFENDIAGLNRLRTALVTDGSLPSDMRAQAIRSLDGLIENLSQLHHTKVGNGATAKG